MYVLYVKTSINFNRSYFQNEKRGVKAYSFKTLDAMNDFIKLNNPTIINIYHNGKKIKL